MTHSKADAMPCRECRIYTLIQTNASCDFLEKSMARRVNLARNEQHSSDVAIELIGTDVATHPE